MRLSPELFRYIVWGGAVLVGSGLAFVDRRILRRWVFAWLLAGGVAIGLLMSTLNPFKFGGGSTYMEGVIVAGGSLLALVGYCIGIAALALVHRRSAL